MDCRYRIWIEDANIQQCRRLRSKNFNGHHLNDSINLEDEENDANEYERIHRARNRILLCVSLSISAI